MTELRRGQLFGASAYVLWGVFPLYFPLLEPASPLEVLAHRVVWSLVVMAVVVVATRRRAQVRAVLADRGRFARLAAAAVVLCVNWGTYIYGVNSGQVVETSLGYFVNPLVTVLLGVVVLGERLRKVQWAALGIALLAVLVLTVENGRPPYLALVLAFSFGTYGLLKKTAGAGAVEGLAVETAVLAPLAAGYLLVLGGDGTALSEGPAHLLMLMGSGVVTAVPLLLFGGAAGRVPLTQLGLLQYLAPTMQLAIGVLVLGEPMGLLRLVGFCLVWTGLVVFTADAVGHARRGRALVPEPV
ncbi:MAG: EamA family transporter RarD [Frankiales bacterium]|nr:EamA family transporter RarD [Frankiales bacterium]